MLTLAMACPVCFGASDSPMAQATNTGIIFMLVVVAVVLVGFASFFITLVRRARAAAVAEQRSAAAFAPDGASAPMEASHSGSGFVSQEGTA